MGVTTMKDKHIFGKSDLIASGILFGFIFLWGTIWAFPYPHPDLWSALAVASGAKCADSTVNCLWLYPVRFLFAFFGVKGALAALGIIGKAALGGCAVAVYFALRELWRVYRPVSGDPESAEGRSVFGRCLPLFVAAGFALCPLAWRSFQYLSPDALVFTGVTASVTLWIFGRGMRRIWFYSGSFLILGVISSAHPVGALIAVLEVFVDAFERWRERLVSGRVVTVKLGPAAGDDPFVDIEEEAREQWADRALRREKLIGLISFLTGFGFAFFFVTRAALVSGAASACAFGPIVSWWVTSEMGAALSFAMSSGGRFALGFLVLVVVAIKVAWRMHLSEMHAGGYWEKRFFAVIAALVGLVFICHDVESRLRPRLAAFRDYADILSESVRGAKWVFTDGRLDDALRLALVEKGVRANVMSVLSSPNRAEMNRLKDLAPEAGDRELFVHGGAEVFTAWARERADRLRESAWQVGGRLVGIHGRVKFRTAGGVMRDLETLEALGKDRVGELERRMRELSRRLIALADARYSSGDLFGSLDRTVRTRFDALLWRAARLASERYVQFTKANLINDAQKERELAARLDELNHTLKLQGEFIERMLPTENLVLTPKEALDVALKRADFQLARKYANQVLVSLPDDHGAHFALAMAALQGNDFTLAARHFEVVRTLRPDEPATLNNLSLCYLKLKRYDDAVRCAERAAELQPEMERIQKNLQELRKAAAKAAENAALREGD